MQLKKSRLNALCLTTPLNLISVNNLPKVKQKKSKKG